MKVSHPLREDVSWNKISVSLPCFSKVILFVRMWVEMIIQLIRKTWGKCHPLREDVSWNYSRDYKISVLAGHPLREDVSWNVRNTEGKTVGIGHPLREDVSWNGFPLLYFIPSNSHPLREDVSWNKYSQFAVKDGAVILFVRMWVEIFWLGRLPYIE